MIATNKKISPESLARTKLQIGDPNSDDDNRQVKIDIIQGKISLQCREPETTSRFVSCRGQLKNMSFPDIVPTAPLKQKVATLEENVYCQAAFNDKLHETFGELSNDLISTEDNLRTAILQLQERFENELATMKKEYDHRFRTKPF